MRGSIERRFGAASILSLLVVLCGLRAQTRSEVRQFEVAAIRPTNPAFDSNSGALVRAVPRISKSSVYIPDFTLQSLIAIAYRLRPYQISGPSWLRENRFDLTAKLPAGDNGEHVSEMLANLLADRFKLGVHRLQKEYLVYALIPSKTGVVLKASPAGVSAAGPDPKMPPRTDADKLRISRTISSPDAGNAAVSVSHDGSIHLEAERITMLGLSELLSTYVDRPVIDMTDVKGVYQLALDISGEDIRSLTKARTAAAGAGGRRAPDDDVSIPVGSSVHAAVQRLGLKLESRKMPLETIVVDHCEKMPSDN